MDPDFLAVDRNVLDGLEVRHSIEEDISLWRSSAVRNRAQASRKREIFGGEVQFEDVVARRRRWRNWIGKRRWRHVVIGPEDRVEAVPDPVSNECGEWTKGRRRCGCDWHGVIRSKVPEYEVTWQLDRWSGILVAHLSILLLSVRLFPSRSVLRYGLLFFNSFTTVKIVTFLPDD
jgi:hypothetical protein